MLGSTVTRDALLVLATVPFFYYVLALFAAARLSRRPCSSPTNFCPPISILKPVRGLDREAYENYASFCGQDYPEFELLFCVSDSDEPAIPVIEKIIADFSSRPIRLLIGSQILGLNDKVNKLCRLVHEAKHEIVLISDSDVRIDPGFLRKIAAPFQSSQVGGVTCLYRGLSDGSVGSDFEALGNSADFAPGVLVAWLLADIDFMLGAVMATSKQQIAGIGGLETLVDYLCDDYELGHRIAKGGHQIQLSRFPVSVVYSEQKFSEALRHQLRWNMAIRCSRPWGHVGLIFSQGLPWSLLAFAVAPHWWMGAAYLLSYGVLRTSVAWTIGFRRMADDLVRRKIWMLPLRDAGAFLVWMWSFFPQRIHWRGQEFYVRDKRLVPLRSRRS